MRLLQFSTVVVGHSHNPTVLNPDFLAMQGIVPKSWGWEVGETITSPPIAFVRFKNDIAISVEPSKLQVIDSGDDSQPEQSKIAEISKAYVRTLPHVHYTAVGNNFQLALPHESPDELLTGLFLKSGPWCSLMEKPLDAFGIRLVHPFDDGQMTTSLESGAYGDLDGSNQSAVIVNVNFNRVVNSEVTTQGIESFLSRSTNDWHTLNTFLDNVFKMEATS